ncbi:hypothetical protein EXIGLDRAFT_839519 [Exidia glandulosa HHB12029]|uniref:Protein kinase domain-containing protein n=1 Tax=Exidia glandulosa HHB12029 TaxID=1314781 RepID=A0A165F0J1_EXIGL|nr:hypothetical protein EXIGLDRAFT_839519 [Exidia glandulosa HHB12029]
MVVAEDLRRLLYILHNAAARGPLDSDIVAPTERPALRSMIMQAPQNILATISLDGLILDRNGNPVSASFRRQELVPDMVHIAPITSLITVTNYPLPMYRPNFEPIDPPPSTLPPAGDLHLSLKLGDFIGDGRSGIVFEAEQVAPDDDASKFVFPPLVVKVVRPGVVLPRCYGWFELESPLDWDVPAWREHPTDGNRTDAEEGPAEFMQYHPDDLRESNIAPIPFMSELAAARNRLFILVLERVGGELKRYPTVQQDMLHAYDEFARLSVNLCRDIRANNIRMSPQSPPGSPSLASPLTGRTHNIRIIDLELTLKTSFTDGAILRSCKSYIRMLVYDL